ncbi:hypothetical protein LguiA_022112 [Lonicera macranthoides]
MNFLLHSIFPLPRSSLRLDSKFYTPSVLPPFNLFLKFWVMIWDELFLHGLFCLLLWAYMAQVRSNVNPESKPNWFGSGSVPRPAILGSSLV